MSERERADVLQELRNLAAKSLAANAELAQHATEIIKQASAGKLESSELASAGGEVLERALLDYVRVSASHASEMIDLGVDVSRNLLKAVRRPDPLSRREIGGPLFDIALSGRPGANVQTAFFLESDHHESITSSFGHSEVTDESGVPQAGLQISMEPPRVEMEPGEKKRVIVAVDVSSDVTPGTYHAEVFLLEHREKSFRLVISVEEALQESETDLREPTSREATPPSPGSQADETESPRSGKGGRGGGPSRP